MLIVPMVLAIGVGLSTIVAMWPYGALVAFLSAPLAASLAVVLLPAAAQLRRRARVLVPMQEGVRARGAV